MARTISLSSRYRYGARPFSFGMTVLALWVVLAPVGSAGAGVPLLSSQPVSPGSIPFPGADYLTNFTVATSDVAGMLPSDLWGDLDDQDDPSQPAARRADCNVTVTTTLIDACAGRSFLSNDVELPSFAPECGASTRLVI